MAAGHADVGHRDRVAVIASDDRPVGGKLDSLPGVEAGDDAQLERGLLRADGRGCLGGQAHAGALVQADLVECEIGVAEAPVQHDPGGGAAVRELVQPLVA